MTWWVALSAGVALLLLLLAVGVPIFVSFLLLNVAGVLVFLGPAGFGLFAASIFTTANTNALAAVPLFILMGDILFRSGAMEVLFDSLDRLIGRIRGRQFVLCILLSAILGALSGAAMAVAGMLGRSLFPSMIRRGYDTRLSVGTILGGASLDPIIPPSVLAIIIATLAQVSTGKLLVAGILPGLLLTGMFLVYVLIAVWAKPGLAPDVAADLADRNLKGSALMAVLRMLPCTFIFFLVMGLVLFGVATPTEAAATGVFGAVVLAAYYRQLSWTMLIEAFRSAVTVSSLLLLVMCCAVMFSQLLTFAGAPRALAETVAGLGLSAPIMVFAMLALPFVLFMFLDQIALMLVLVPIYMPLLKSYGIDEIWFWTLFLVVATVGGISPPFGYTLFAMKSAAPEVPMSTIYSAAWPFVWIIVLGMLVMALYPPLVTFLPNLATP
jgi:tripartite ATP-independent transporter DctM subunit